MTQNTGNLRVRRTQKLLREALVDLIEESGFEALTVGEITQRAMVSRAAFYRNYQDKYDLVEQIFNEAMQPLMNALGHLGPEQPPKEWVQLFEHVAANARLYRALLGGKGSHWFATKMRAALTEMTSTHVGERFSRNRAFTSGLIPTLLGAFYVEAITWWLEQGQPYTPLEFTQLCSDLAAALFQKASTWER